MLTRLTIAASALALMAACSNETPAPAATAEAPAASEAAAAAAPAEPAFGCVGPRGPASNRAGPGLSGKSADPGRAGGIHFSLYR